MPGERVFHGAEQGPEARLPARAGRGAQLAEQVDAVPEPLLVVLPDFGTHPGEAFLQPGQDGSVVGAPAGTLPLPAEQDDPAAQFLDRRAEVLGAAGAAPQQVQLLPQDPHLGVVCADLAQQLSHLGQPARVGAGLLLARPGGLRLLAGGAAGGQLGRPALGLRPGPVPACCRLPGPPGGALGPFLGALRLLPPAGRLPGPAPFRLQPCVGRRDRDGAVLG